MEASHLTQSPLMPFDENSSPDDQQRENPIAEFRTRLLNIRTLPLLLRVILVTTIVLIFAAALVFGLLSISSNPIYVGNEKGALQIPLPAYIVATLCSTLGWICLFVGAFMTGHRVRIVLVTIFIVLLTLAPIQNIVQSNTVQPFYLLLILSNFIQVFVLLGLCIWLFRIDYESKSTKDKLQSRTIVFVSMAMVCYFFIDTMLTILSSFEVITVKENGIVTILQFLPTISAGVIIWSSTDFIEWGETLTGAIITLFHQKKWDWLVYLLVGTLAAASLIDMIRRLNVVSLLPGVGVTLLIIIVIAVLTMFARVDQNWPHDLPLPALLFVAFFLYFITNVTNILAQAIALQFHIPQARENFILTLIAMGASLMLLVTGFFLLRGKHGNDLAARHASGLFLCIVALLILSLNIPQFLNGFQLPLFAALQPSPASFKIIATVGTILILLWFLMRGQLKRTIVFPFILAAIMIAGLQCVGWYYQIFLPNLRALATQSVLIATIFLVIAILWDLMLSGGQVTNKDSVLFPRDGRILLYLGYVLNALVLFLYVSTQKAGESTFLSAAANSGSYFEVVGAFGLGVPLVIFTFVQRFAQWVQRHHFTMSSPT